MIKKERAKEDKEEREEVGGWRLRKIEGRIQYTKVLFLQGLGEVIGK